MTPPSALRFPAAARGCLIDPRRTASNDTDPVPPVDVAQALRSLPGLQRDVLRLRYAAGCNEDDIAAVLDLPVADVARLLREASDALCSAIATRSSALDRGSAADSCCGPRALGGRNARPR